MYMSSVKNSNKFTIKHINSNATNMNKETFNFALDVNQVINDSDTAVALDTFARGFVALSKDSYNDCQIVTTKNLNSIAGGVS